VQAPEDCEVVRRIFRLYLDIGTYNGVARRPNRGRRACAARGAMVGPDGQGYPDEPRLCQLQRPWTLPET